ncbi:arylsulfatase regulator (Fe-S oxidoreductase) [Leptolyngbya sp. PCC 7375]|nr:arylsulfatase regulator (Fe-S oxidoreductase) [Leptolyngbya sp. PCC 7375]
MSQTTYSYSSVDSISKSIPSFKLIVIQATSFCNLDCDYCYLPDRAIKEKISVDIIEAIFTKIFKSSFFRNNISVCWHAGEPLALSQKLYETFFLLINQLSEKYNVQDYKIRQNLQTNATLITQKWCDFFIRHKVSVGVSVDGPAFLHDRHRKTRKGIGSHAATLRGIRLLQQNQIPFRVITVLTQDSLDYPDEIFQFFLDHKISHVGFNVEEIEGIHRASSLQQEGTTERFRKFLQRWWELTKANIDPSISLREFEKIGSFIYHNKRIHRNDQTTPFEIVSIDTKGNFSTFSPELLSMPSPEYGDFILGNLKYDTFESVCNTEKFQRLYEAISIGVEQCRQSCQYFGFCGGGAPSNKYYENGAFQSTETMNCCLHQQAVVDTMLTNLEALLKVQ